MSIKVNIRSTTHAETACGWPDVLRHMVGDILDSYSPFYACESVVINIQWSGKKEGYKKV